MKFLLALLALAVLPLGLIERLTEAGIVPKEVLFGSLVKGPFQVDPSSNASQFVGQVLVASGSATATVSTVLVNSDSLIFLTAVGNASIASAQSRGFEVRTMSPGNFFTVGTPDAQPLARDTTINFMMLCPS